MDLLNKISFPPQLVFIDNTLNEKQVQVAMENLKLKSSFKRNSDNIDIINQLKKVPDLIYSRSSVQWLNREHYSEFIFRLAIVLSR